MANINSGVNKGQGIQGQADKKSPPSPIKQQVADTATKVVKTLDNK